MSRKKTHGEFVEEMKNVNPNIEVVGTYINNKTKILCKCKIDGREWTSLPTSLLRGDGCPQCGLSSRTKLRRKTHDVFLEEMQALHPNIEVLSEYINSHTKVLCRCKIDGHEWYSSPPNLLTGKGCAKCGNSIKKTHKEFVSEMSITNPNIEIIGTYNTARTKILARCKICGREWCINPTDLLKGVGCCSKYNKSKGEIKIEKYFLENNIDFDLYYKFDGLIGVNGRRLSYDFYLPYYNLLIEYQGRQHYESVDIFGGDEQFHIQQEHDKRKREYAKTHNIDLLEIPHWDFDNIETILESRLLKQSA